MIRACRLSDIVSNFSVHMVITSPSVQVPQRKIASWRSALSLTQVFSVIVSPQCAPRFTGASRTLTHILKVFPFGTDWKYLTSERKVH